MLGGLLYWLRRLADPPHFIVSFTHGGARCARGEPPTGVLADCQAIAEDFAITAGHLDIRRRDGRFVLHFSPEIPTASHQRFRNVLGNRR